MSTPPFFSSSLLTSTLSTAHVHLHLSSLRPSGDVFLFLLDPYPHLLSFHIIASYIQFYLQFQLQYRWVHSGDGRVGRDVCIRGGLGSFSGQACVVLGTFKGILSLLLHATLLSLLTYSFSSSNPIFPLSFPLSLPHFRFLVLW